MERKCKHCACWDWDGKSDDGFCKAHAPKPQILVAKSDHVLEEEGIIIREVIFKKNRNDYCYHDFVEKK